ncbi:hypothetical protein [Haemophilus haemolyticus]|uniref:hypothetical protein n=1 Tax=Haemophilus haemolyticus TaxID=726 RepID=UPI00025E6471|nr:hypothetical protein [Haemophilus haemolyticus]EIJ72766.1 hypothetical protein HMPREF1053_0849 [Haemophilus haemolyticus HK386]OBX39073.1 hypothetical protein A8M50_06690 [Haemophilus haemolyticus]
METESNFIYEKIASQIEVVIDKLSQQNAKDKIDQDISFAIDNLYKLNGIIQKELNELKKISEWKKFTIAFYGETNAGKSTLIEALRIFLKEKSKVESQKKFKELAEKSGLTEEAFCKVRQIIMSKEKAIEEAQEILNKLDQKYAESIMRAEVEVRHLSELLEKIRKNQKWWQRFISLFIPIKEKEELVTARQLLSEIKAEKQKESEDFKSRLKTLLQEKKDAEAENTRLIKETESLKEFADGQIIGDGRSDFTRDNTSFDFNYNNHEFALIDVPGIEGDESVVRTAIEEAVKKAHAIFYVTRTARPPQTHEGEKGDKKGTLEKMKEHLGAQTEVWTIYNHAVNNPRSLKQPLIGQGEKDGLRALDEKLKQELVEKYCQSLIVSARPAYLGLTECVIPGSKDANEQRKFLERFGTRDKILELSGLPNFVEKLSSEIIVDYRNKIKRSNLNKACQTLDSSICDLKALSQKFKEDRKKVRDEVLNSQTRIIVLMEQFTGILDSLRGKILQAFQNEIRASLYYEIDKDISNDAFKRNLKNEMELQAQKLENKLRNSIELEANKFGEELLNIVKRTSLHLNNIVNERSNSFSIKNFNLDIKIDNGLNLIGLVSSGVAIVISIVSLASNPVGWTFAFVGGVLAAVGALIGVTKSVIGFFSSDYKKSQQRKETDNAIRKAANQIGNEMEKILNDIKNAMNEEVEKVSMELQAPLKQYKSVIEVLEKAETELEAIFQTI